MLNIWSKDYFTSAVTKLNPETVPLDPASSYHWLNRKKYSKTLTKDYYENVSTGKLSEIPYLGRGIEPYNKIELENSLYVPQPVEKKRGYSPTIIVSNEGGEFISNELKSFYAKKGIEHPISEPYYPEHKGKAKRSNRTEIDATRAIFSKEKVPKLLWDESLKSALLGVNLFSKKVLIASPWEIYHA
ncbi:hypothetical protein O181_039457 [Austropuccinia psidii MF-1]|uniref:Integrase catalytic domain-containing protein n=1 Tax=Austropuccinia psidii MF-1 TaxID=1389203 RepID=A0A9Q3DGU8_9BASI|nr:hypothetical protein [Austropuccinia psidii MF-1]